MIFIVPIARQISLVRFLLMKMTKKAVVLSAGRSFRERTREQRTGSVIERGQVKKIIRGPFMPEVAS